MKQEWIMVDITELQWKVDPLSFNMKILVVNNVIKIKSEKVLKFSVEMTPGFLDPSWCADVILEINKNPQAMLQDLGFETDFCKTAESITTIRVDGGIVISVMMIGEPCIESEPFE